MIRVVSLFAGIGGFDEGFRRAGMQTIAAVEIDPNCRKLLASRFPKAQLFDDIRQVGKHNLPTCDVICGGFPCQDLSMAGRRAGLKGKHSGLFYEMTRITDELKPAFIVWENVSGLLSSDKGRDFARVLLELDRIGYSGAWTTLDAQYWAVAQRRIRVFGVFARRDIGAERACEILAIREGMSRNTPPRREAGQDVAGTLESRADGGGFPGTDGACAGHIVPALTATGVGAGRTGNEYNEANFCIPIVTHTLRAEADASEDGTGRGTPLIPVVASLITAGYTKDSGINDGRKGRPQNLLVFDERNITSKANRSRVEPGRESHTLHSTPPMIAIRTAQTNSNGCGIDDSGTAYTLDGVQGQAVAIHPHCIGRAPDAESQGKEYLDDGSVYTHDARGVAQAVAGMGICVRRLTPTECCRLQGFPDDWFDGLGFSDSVKYRTLGNAVCVNVSYWIGKRLMFRP